MSQRFYMHPLYKRVYGHKMVTPRCNGAWPALVTPRQPPTNPGQEPGAPRYEITLVLKKDDPAAETFIANLQVMVKEMLAQYNLAAKKDARPQLAIDEPLIDGDAGKFELEKYPYYENSWLLIARNVKVPVYKNHKGQNFEDASVFKGGDIVRAEVTPHIGSTGVSYKIEALQLIKRGETPMGGAGVVHGLLLESEEDGEDLVASEQSLGVEEDGEDVAAESTEAEGAEEEVAATNGAAPVEAAPKVTVTGKQLAEQLKANAAAAVKGQSAPAQKPAQAVPAKGKMAAVNIL